MIRDILAGTIGKKEVNAISRMLLQDREQFEQVFEMIFDEAQPIAWHAAWIIEKVSEKAPSSISKEQNLRLINLVLTTEHQGLQRIGLSILHNLSVYQPISVEFINRCFEMMVSPKFSVGVQCLAMRVMLKISEVEEGFKSELSVYLENMDDEFYSAGFKTSKRKVLKSLKMS